MQKGSNTPPRKKKPGRVSLPANQFGGLRDPSSPFTGISKTNAPAKNTRIEHLTAQVALAKARRQRVEHGGLLTPQQRAAEQKAAKVLAKPAPQTPSKPSARKSQGVSTPGNSNAAPKSGAAYPAKGNRPEGPTRILPLPSTAPFVAPPPSAPASAPSSTLPPGRRGTTNPRAQLQAAQPHQGGLLGQAADYLTGPALGHTGAARVAHALDLAAGTTIAALGPSLVSDVQHPIARIQEARKRGLVTTNEASLALANRVGHLGVSGAIPKGFKIPSIDLVAPAGAAGPKRPITKDELAQLEQQGYDLKPRLLKRFTSMALKNGWSQADLEGLSGSARIDKAFTKPPALPLRILGNAAAGVARLGTLPAGIEGAVRETAAGHGGEVAKALGEGLISELPIVGKHKTTDTAVADPFGFITQFAGAGKTVGTASGLARSLSGLGRAGQAARIVETASSGLKVERGALSKNAYTATGQAISDAAARRLSPVGARLESKQVDTLVRAATNKHAPEFVAVQRPYKAALDKVGRKRAAELQAYQQAGGKPEQIAAFYRAQGEASPAKFYDRVAKNTQALSPEDHVFLGAHAALTQKTTQALMEAGKFSDTAAAFRRYSPLIRSSARLGDPDAQRILALRDEYLKGFDVMPEQDVAALRGAIDQGVSEYAAKHTAAGGIEPAYVEYGKPKPLIGAPYKPGAGGPTGFKTPRGRQKAETGATFESGKYLIDPASPLAESVRAQRQHLASVLHQDVSQAIGQHLTAGDPIPPGHVFVSETNLRGLRRTSNDLADNPVSAPDYYAEEAGVRQRLYDHLSANTQASGERVPRGEKGYAIPQAAWKRILDHTRPPSRGAYDRFLSQYQRALISYRPSTIVNNTIGSLPLAMTGGAGPKSFIRAAQAMRDPTLAPAILRGHGVAGSFAPTRSRVGVGMDFMRAQSARGEDFSRLATYFAKAGPTFKKRAAELNMSADDYQRALAAGTVDPQQLNTFLDHAEKFVGDVAKPDGAIARKFGKVVLFHRWLGHMARLMLVTLPVEHPRRLAILQSLAAYGDQYRQEHGVWPDWYREYLPLFQHVERLGRAGKPQTFTKTFSTQGVNPFSTLNQFANPVSTSDFSSKSFTEAAKGLALGVANPLLQVPLNTVFNRPYDSTDAGRYFLGQGLRQIPGVSVVRPQGGMSPDSIPFFSEKQKVYSSGKKRNGKSVPLPYDFRPGARPEGGILGTALRYTLGGVYDVPAQGPAHNIEQKKHIGAKARDARKARKG